jgi:GT2 family glycosyltransferase
VIALLRRFERSDPRIKVEFRKDNGHISEASNSALALAKGDYIVLVDHDDAIPAHCLAVIARAINDHPGAQVLYSDEDKLDTDGVRRDPYFKGAFNEYLMFGHNMVSHIGVYSRALVTSIGGFRKGYEGSQDYDLLLRCLDQCDASRIVHIPHVLYHWRMLPGSTAVSADQKSYAIDAAQRALNDHFDRRGLPYRSIDGVAPGLSGLAIRPMQASPLISVIIPTRDGLDLLSACIDSILLFRDEALEIIVVDNGSVQDETILYLEKMAMAGLIRVVQSPGAFNFSHLCNLGVEAATGEIICLLNNDTEVLAADWLQRARAHLSVPQVGVVGARLLYPDRTLQHFGLYLGLGAHRIAGSPHRGLPEASFGYFGKARLIQEFSAVTAACLFVRRSDYEAAGGFDEALAVAYNDVDFCLKIRDLGLKVICDPDITLIHKESKSRGADTDPRKAARLEDEAQLVRDRWGERLTDDPYYSPNLTVDDDDMSMAPRPRVTLPWRAPKDEPRPAPVDAPELETINP